MKKIVLIITFLFTFITCGTYKQASWSNIGTDGSLVEVYNGKITVTDFKKMCVKDTLSSDLENWLEMNFYDVKNGVRRQWIYIKDTDTNKVYVLTNDTDSTYHLNIRTIIVEKEK